MSLGELGAVDPARVSIVLPSAKLPKPDGTTDKDKNDSKDKNKTDPRIKSHTENAPPWDLTLETIGLGILEDHLVPELKSTAHAHDRTCFAIQDILKALSKRDEGTGGTGEKGMKNDRGDGGDIVGKGERVGKGGKNGVICIDITNTSTSTNTSASSSTAPPKPLKNTPMPESLRSDLSARQILDITEPFWVTNYTMRTLDPVKESPIYKAGCTFVQWLGRWARKLGTEGPSVFH